MHLMTHMTQNTLAELPEGSATFIAEDKPAMGLCEQYFQLYRTSERLL